ncbi:MAG: adenylate kinase [Lachnospiraceae bacterium]|jgi:adenylate kinase family enzyme|nr:adenylate kinase [Lachnospiraceae bacterium]
MVILITGASHTGKTALAQRLLEKYQIPYLSIDHLKMGLIRSKNTTLTPMSDEQKLTDFLWPIVAEIIKTVIENRQNLIVEGCYIPFGWEKDFGEEYLREIRYYCLIMSEKYIKSHFADIKKFANVIEARLDDQWLTIEAVLEENRRILEQCRRHQVNPVWIDESYLVDLEL